jgi:ABC-type phosphate/phosphonate transport system substrate-binding protein
MLSLRRLIFLFFSLQIAQAAGLNSLLAADGRVLVFGRAQDDAVRAIRDRQEFVDYMAKKLAPVGISGGKILVVDNLHLLAQAIKENKVDLFHDSPVPTMVLARQTGAIPILRQWKYGEAEYESVILARKSSGIETLTDLEGKVLGFDEPHSTSAHVVPRMLLTEKKLKLVHLTSTGGAKPKAVGYVFGSDGSAVNLLITGRLDAATTSLREYNELRPEIRDSLKIVGKTMSVPRQLIGVRKDLEPKLVKALREVLVSMDRDPEGQQVLRRQQKSTKIDEIPVAAMQQLKTIEKFVFSLPEKVSTW